MTGNLISTDIYQNEGVQSKEIQLFSDQNISLMALIVPNLQLFAYTKVYPKVPGKCS
jgi:hypothetical protein